MSAAREQALRLVREGYELHYARPGADPDLALLDGDHLYAAGLERLAAEGRPEAAGASWRATTQQMGVTDFTPS